VLTGRPGAAADQHPVRRAVQAVQGQRALLGEVAVEDQGHYPAVVEDLPHLGGGVTVVDVQRYGAQLEAGEERDHERHAVPGHQPDAGAGSHAVSGEVVGEPVRPALQFGERYPLALADEDKPVRDGIGHLLELVSEIAGHLANLRWCRGEGSS
jgi:hypothetical protein